MRAVADLSEGEVRGEIGGAERGVRRTGDFNILIGVRAGLSMRISLIWMPRGSRA
jgi:hypothetical protein